MEFVRLHYFMVLSRYKNYSKAAEELHITQPTLSQQISELEQNIGVKLINRTRHSFELTEAGVVFLKKVNKLFDSYDDCFTAIESFRQGKSGSLTIATLDKLEPTFLVQYLKIFSTNYPDVKVKMVQSTYVGMLDLLQSGKTDLAVTLFHDSLNYRDLKFTKFNTDKLVIGVAKNSGFDNIENTDDPRIKNVLKLKRCVYLGWYEIPEVENFISKYVKKSDIETVSDSVTLTLKLLNEKEYCIVPERWLGIINDSNNIHQIDFTQDYASLDLGFAYKKNHSNPCIEPFINLLSAFNFETINFFDK